MSMNNCPHCGKPIRPGTRFCGNCGNSVNVPSARPSPAITEAAALPAKGNGDEAFQVGWLPCPHCGKPVRPGAKFCHSCGQAILTETTAKTEPLLTAAEQATAPVTPFADQAPVSFEGGAEQRTTRKQRSRTAIPLLISGLILACVFAIVGGYIYFRDPFNLFTLGPLALNTDTQVIPTAVNRTVEPSLVPTETPAVATLASTSTAIPSPTPTTQPTHTTVPTATISQPEVILAEDFDGALNEQWVVWLEPNSPYRPKIDTGPGEKFLFLLADQEPGKAGVTSRVEIPFTSGLDIQFIGQLTKDLPGHVMIFDWDPVDVERGPLSTLPGEIHLEIWRDQIILNTSSGEPDPCQMPIRGSEQHTYRIVLGEDQKLLLYIDGSQDPVCFLETKLVEPELGYISFTGTGWITKIQVTAPPE